MKTETEKELRELDIFCAEKVMGWKQCDMGWLSPNPDISISKRIPRLAWLLERCFEAWSPTTNPADALAVLERCADGRSIVINKDTDGTFTVAELMRGNLGLLKIGTSANSKTKEITICQFAKALYSK